MSLEVRFAVRAAHEVRALEPRDRERVLAAIRRWAETGVGDVVRLRGVAPPELRLRVGDYRVRFRRNGEQIEVLRVAHRREVYRG